MSRKQEATVGYCMPVVSCDANECTTVILQTWYTAVLSLVVLTALTNQAAKGLSFSHYQLPKNYDKYGYH